MHDMVVLIVAMVIVASVFKAKFRRDTVLADTPDTGGARAATSALQSEIRALKQRVATLERIAIDGSSALDREIEALRDRP